MIIKAASPRFRGSRSGVSEEKPRGVFFLSDEDSLFHWCKSLCVHMGEMKNKTLGTETAGESHQDEGFISSNTDSLTG